MPSRRRYRLLLFSAAIAVFLFYRAADNGWDGHDADRDWDALDYEVEKLDHYPPVRQWKKPSPATPQPAQELVSPPSSEDGGYGHDEPGSGGPPVAVQSQDETSVDEPAQGSSGSPPPALVDDPTVTAVPDQPPAADPPATSTSTQVHWRDFPENFPVAEEDYILLPTGAPKPIPKIQFDFPPEPPAAKATREARLAEIKAEMVRAWSGYRAHAWMHDELSPVTRSFRDPFCGWAATLVDSLDTLWIMGLRDEFDEAALAVADIDFTYSPTRNDIPVFETTIRYLGGLLAAYDVSGGEAGGYAILLEKAEELAEILMGAFDTPNRMPVLYYQWRPEFVSQPRRATTVSVAELGTLLMEFTRLSQLTGRVKYYDAVARITDALEAMQERGTNLDGIFPERLDVSGCNRTATNLARQAAYEAMAKENEDVPSPPAMMEKDASGFVGKTSFAGPSHPERTGGDGRADEVAGGEQGEDGFQAGEGEITEGHLAKRGLRQAEARSPPAVNPWSTAAIIDLDCVKQPPIVPAGYGYESYSMGGSQDSTYEYFPKVSTP